MELKVDTSIPVTFEQIDSPEWLDERFIYCKVWICHTGVNFNNSDFSKEVVTNMIPSLVGIPIVGYISTNNIGDIDFNGHEQKLVIDKDGIRIEYIGRAYGCILEDNNAQFEMKTLESGEEKEYLTCNGILWRKFEESATIFDRDVVKGHSMELDRNSIQGNFGKDNVFHFTDAKFEALCILGEGIEPAMDGSIIETFTKSDIKEQYNQMFNELSELIKNQSFSKNVDIDSDKGGNNVDEKLKLIEQYQFTLEQLKEKEIDIEQYSLEDLEGKLKEMSQPEVDFALTNVQLQTELRNELRNEKIKDSWGYESSRFYYVDSDDSSVYAEDYKDNWNIYKFSYTMVGDKVEIDFLSAKRQKTVFVDFEDGNENDVVFSIISNERKDYVAEVTEKQFNTEKENVSTEMQAKIDDVQVKYEALEQEVIGLREFKQSKVTQERTDAENELFERFSAELTEEEVNVIKETASEFTIEQLEEKLFTLVGKKKATFSVAKPSKQTVKVVVEGEEKEIKNGKPYDHLFEKFATK